MRIPYQIRGKKYEEYVFEVVFPGDVENMPPVGTKLDKDTVVASGGYHDVAEMVDLVELLGRLKKHEVQEGLACFDGEVVNKGHTLFSKRSLGIKTQEIKAPVAGLISLRDISRGKILILDTEQKITIPAGLEGVVSGVYPDGIIQVKSAAYGLELFRLFGEKVGGILTTLKREDFKIEKGKVVCKVDLDHKIAMINFALTKDIYVAVLRAGAVGVVAPSCDSGFLREISKFKMITIALLEGWGLVQVPTVVEKYLKKVDGMYVELEPSSISKFLGRMFLPYVESVFSAEPVTFFRKNAEEGDLVVVFEPPYWSKEGSIINTLEEEGLISVRLRSGETIVVPPTSIYLPVLR